MNICIVYGKIVSKIEFAFIINVKKYYSIVIFQIELDNKSIVTVKGYNEIADYCYKNLSKGNYCVIEGKINVKEVDKLYSIVEKETFEIEINSIRIEKLGQKLKKFKNSIDKKAKNIYNL